jgi:hypothetical protein
MYTRGYCGSRLGSNVLRLRFETIALRGACSSRLRVPVDSRVLRPTCMLEPMDTEKILSTD